MIPSTSSDEHRGDNHVKHRQLASNMMMLSLAFIAYFIGCSSAQDAPIANTTYGQVRGAYVTLENGTVIDSYLNIPFAKPPVGALRFQVRPNFATILLNVKHNSSKV